MGSYARTRNGVDFHVTTTATTAIAPYFITAPDYINNSRSSRTRDAL